MARTRSARLITIGVAVLIVGIGMAWLAVRSAGGASATTTTTSATSATAQDEPVEPTEPPERLPERVDVPDGHEAVAVQLPFDASMAGVPAPGEPVNVYGVFTHGRPGEEEPAAEVQASGPVVERVLSGVEVLAVTGPEVQDAGGSPTVVLALTPEQAAQVVFLQANERIWLSVPGDGAAGDDVETATDYGSILR